MKILLSLLTLVLFGNCNTETISEPILLAESIPVIEIQPQEKDSVKNKLEWIADYDIENTLINRIETPGNFFRKEYEVNSFAHWIRRLPLKKGTPSVQLYNGNDKWNQDAHAYVVDLDVGERDLQQCADATMRIRSEYLFHTKQFDKIHFNYTNGALVPYSKWRNGLYPIPKGKTVSWVRKEKCNHSYKSFKTYLIQVFNYAGTHSLSKELTSIPFMEMQIGDLLIKGGFPGHAVMVVDIIENKVGEKKYLLAQSYMPAQDFQILKSPNQNSPWYDLNEGSDYIDTPEWTFQPSQLMRWN
jgi:hypothetical protein